MVFEEDKQPLAENADRTFRQTSHFDEFVVWNYDQVPSRNDGLTMAVEGFCLTEEVGFCGANCWFIYILNSLYIQQLHKRVDPIELELFLLSGANSADSSNKMVE